MQELCYYTGVSRQGVRSLERAGLLSLRSQEEYRITRQDYAAAAEEIRLNDEPVSYTHLKLQLLKRF